MAQSVIVAKVTSLNGEAFARDAAGKLRHLKLGDVIREGESVVASDGSQVLLALADGREMTVRSGEVAKLDAEVAAQVMPDTTDSALVNNPQGFQKIAKAIASGSNLDTLLDEDAPAAGAVVGGNEGHTFVEFLRIVETVAPQSFQFDGGAGRGAVALEFSPVLVDTTAPTLTAQLDPNSDSGTKGDGITNNNKPTIIGTGEPGAKIDVTIPGTGEHLTATVDGSGKWTVTPTQAIPDGPISIPVIETDKAGNPTAANVPLIIDTIAPSAPTVTILDGNNGLNAAEIAAGVKATIDVSKAAVGDTLTVHTGSAPDIVKVLSATDISNGVTITVPAVDVPANGTVTVSATVTDPSLNVSGPGSDSSVTDSLAPSAAVISATTPTGSISGLFNTGVDANGNALTAGVKDAHYTLVSEPVGATFTSAVAVSQTDASNQNWSTTDYAHSEWIGATATNPKTGTFKYQTSFTLSGSVDLKSVDVQFDINADDNVVILVNGHNTGITLSALWTSSSVQHVDLSGASGWFVTGTNVIEFDVTNTGAGPTGLKIDNIAATALTTDTMPVSIALTGTGALAGDTLIFTANDGTTTTTVNHVLTQTEVNAGSVVETETLPTGNTVSTYAATLVDAAGNSSVVATETVFGSGNLSATAATVGADVFKWTLDSHGTAGSPATDKITGFNVADNDVLDLRDLLIGENHTAGIGNLANYINITTSVTGGVTSTEIRISHSGGFAGGAYSAAAEDQHITLNGVNLFSTYGDTLNANLIQHLLTNGKLTTD